MCNNQIRKMDGIGGCYVKRRKSDTGMLSLVI
jgi:hypothetical protein